MEAHLLGSTEEFMQTVLPQCPCCLVLDVRLPGMNGIDFQLTLQNAGIDIPIIFITGHGDIRMTVQAMRAGAIEFLTKPFRNQDLLDAVRFAIEKNARDRDVDELLSSKRRKYLDLTSREREIIPLVASGLMNKQIGFRLGISEITVKVHRGNAMRKMGVRSLTELVRISDALELKVNKHCDGAPLPMTVPTICGAGRGSDGRAPQPSFRSHPRSCKKDFADHPDT